MCIGLCRPFLDSAGSGFWYVHPNGSLFPNGFAAARTGSSLGSIISPPADLSAGGRFFHRGIRYTLLDGTADSTVADKVEEQAGRAGDRVRVLVPVCRAEVWAGAGRIPTLGPICFLTASGSGLPLQRGQ